MPKLIDLSNTETEYFKILDLNHKQVREDRKTSYLYFYNCICKRCGNKAIVRSSYITGHTKSCGCLLKRSGKDSPFFKGYGEIPQYFFRSIQRCAKGGGILNRKEKDFNVSIKYVWDLFLKQNRKCALSGLELSFVGSASENKRTTSSKRTASLDRIDSTKGYVEGNVQWVHKDINIMKNKFSKEYFLSLCKSVINSNT